MVPKFKKLVAVKFWDASWIVTMFRQFRPSFKIQIYPGNLSCLLIFNMYKLFRIPF